MRIAEDLFFFFFPYMETFLKNKITGISRFYLPLLKAFCNLKFWDFSSVNVLRIGREEDLVLFAVNDP